MPFRENNRTSNDESNGRGFFGSVYVFVRLLQYVLSLAVIGMYGYQIHTVQGAGGVPHVRLYAAEAVGILLIIVTTWFLVRFSRSNDKYWRSALGKFQWAIELLMMYVLHHNDYSFLLGLRWQGAILCEQIAVGVTFGRRLCSLSIDKSGHDICGLAGPQ